MIYLLVNDEKTIGRPSHLTGSNLVFQFSVPGINCNALQWLKHIHVCPNLFHSWKWWQRRTTVMISLNTRMELKRMQKYWNFPFDRNKIARALNSWIFAIFSIFVSLEHYRQKHCKYSGKCIEFDMFAAADMFYLWSKLLGRTDDIDNGNW